MWPDWRGEAAAIIASGMSTKKANVGLLKGRCRVIAIKQNHEIAPFADVVYGCDGPWWRSVQGLKKFNGLKLSWENGVCNSEFGIQKVEIDSATSDRMLFDKVGLVGAGGNSGFQALNLAIQFGANRILLVGFDAQGTYGNEHWYGRNTAMGMNNPDENNYRRWRRAFGEVSGEIAARGVEVINTSLDSAITCFKKQSIEETLQMWGLQNAA